MKKLKTVGPLQKGRIRIIIRYRNGEVVYYEGVYNPDSNLKPLQAILNKRPPKPQPLSMSPRQIEDSVTAADVPEVNQ